MAIEQIYEPKKKNIKRLAMFTWS